MSEGSLIHERLESFLKPYTYGGYTPGDRRLMPYNLEEFVNALLIFIYDEIERREAGV